jgi:magnesium chelatase subunit D
LNANRALPFPALVGLDEAQQALLLLAVDPRLQGVVIAAGSGTGKSSLARGFRALLDPATPFVELPLHADEDSLLGGLDLEATLRAGRRIIRQGIFARAHGGVVYVDSLNLLPDSCAHLLLSALEHGAIRLERDGVSARVPARFSLVATYDPAEGVPTRHLLDRAGLLVVAPPAPGTEQRAQAVRHNLTLPLGEWEAEAELVSALIRAARAQLPLVTIADAQIEQLAAAATAFGVEGQRADLFAARAACAAAALALRERVEHADLDLALRLVIAPRATRHPTQAQPEPQSPQPAPEQAEKAPQQPAPPHDAAQGEQDANDAQPAESAEVQAPAEQVFQALDTELPAELAELPFRVQRRGRSGSRGSTSGRRGRHVRSVPGDPRGARIDVSATLHAAAPWQGIRKAPNESPSAEAGSRLSLLGSDLRVKEFRTKAGALFCFAVDASGSMALHRMRQAKGAVHALLQRAYVHRDRVALLAFHGQGADVLLQPSQSVELARRALDLLPTGGGTPIAAALLAALGVARQARGRGIFQTVLIMLTDGRANIGLRAAHAGVAAELQQLSQHVAAAGIQSVVIDTQRSFLSKGEARRLAGWLGGTYVYLPNASGEQVADLAMGAAERAGSR